MRADIELGDRVQDQITLFRGIVTVIEDTDTGMKRIQVQSQELHNGKTIKPEIFDAEDLTILKKQVIQPTPVEYDGDITLGCIAKDRTTGFEGKVSSLRTSISGCLQVAVRPTKLDKDGNVRRGVLFDINELELVKAAEPKHELVGTGAARHGKSAR